MPLDGGPMTDIASEIYELLSKDHPSEEEFDRLLKHVPPGVLAKCALNMGLPFVFKGQPHTYLTFKEAVARIYAVPPQDIAVMGSAKFGFSTSPHKQDGGAKPIDEDSDLDLVIVSERLYRQALQAFASFSFSILRDVDALKKDDLGEDAKAELPALQMQRLRNQSKGFAFGWVSPGDLEDGTELKQHYYDMQREANTQLFGQQPPGPIARIGARVYKDWDSAERSYEFSFKQLAKARGVKVVKTSEVAKKKDLDFGDGAAAKKPAAR